MKNYKDGEIEQTVGEEIANSITHGVGFLLSIAALVVGVVLAAKHSSPKVTTAVSIYGATMCILYLSSTLFHAFPQGYRAKKVFHVFDHCSIYLLIAGTYTPVCLGPVNATWGWSLFGVIWGLALIGVIMKAFFTGRFKIISTIAYLLMGWLIVIAFKPLWASIGPKGFAWLAAGGISYSLGCIFYLNRRIKFAHMIWHILVLLGTTTHFFGILLHVVLK